MMNYAACLLHVSVILPATKHLTIKNLKGLAFV
jgi:hypothetical protein